MVVGGEGCSVSRVSEINDPDDTPTGVVESGSDVEYADKTSVFPLVEVSS